MEEVKVCRQCGEDYLSLNKDDGFCSDTCSQNYDTDHDSEEEDG